MKRLREKMDMHTVRRARAMVGGEEVEWSDTEVSGLCIRIRARSAVWVIRGRQGAKQSIWTLGPVENVSLSQARDWSAQAKKLLKGGADPAGWLREKATGVPEPVPAPPPVADTGQTWEQGREAFLDFVKSHRAAATYDDYRKTLRSSDMASLGGRRLDEIRSRDIRHIQEEIFARGKIAMAHHALRILKSCLAWLAQNSKSGIEESPAMVVRPLDPGKLARSGVGHRLGWVPTPEEIGRLPWVMAAHTGTPSARLAASLILFTGQRIETVLSSGKGEFEAKLDGGVWDVSPAYMKSKRRHIIPLPGTAWHIARAAMAMSPDTSTLVFPQTRERRAGSGLENHMSPGAVADSMGGMGRHALRRAFASYGKSVLGFSLPEIKGILDHAEGSGGDVTMERYELSDGQYYKWRVLRAWEAWVLTQVAEQAPKGAGKVPAFLRLPVGPRMSNGQVWANEP